MTCCNNSIGDWFDIKMEEKESDLLDAELARQQQEQLIAYMSDKKVTSVSPDSNKQKYIILGGVALLLVVAIILKG